MRGMERAASVALRWAGRIFVLLAVYVLVCSLFLPAGVQVLNPIACPEGLELDNARYALPNGPDNSRLELVCTSPEYSQSAAAKIALVVVGFLTLGLIAVYFSDRLRRGHFRAPQGPTIR